MIQEVRQTNKGEFRMLARATRRIEMDEEIFANYNKIGDDAAAARCCNSPHHTALRTEDSSLHSGRAERKRMPGPFSNIILSDRPDSAAMVQHCTAFMACHI